ncbi:MAG: cyclic nucleotide-binding domain-containing protein [Calditrichae bacterium]|nr:cyclic nucleotide-binding domain-containing protein [Calditrichia bacterium]
MLTVIEKVVFLQNVDVFADVPTEDLAYLATIADEVTFPENNEIYKEDEPSDALYLVLEGEVRLHRDGREITVAGPKEAFGTWALFDEAPRVVTATPLSECRLLKIDREDFFDLLADHIQITQGVFKTLVQRLRSLMETFSSGEVGSPNP